jgi:cytochrome c peroxidase
MKTNHKLFITVAVLSVIAFFTSCSKQSNLVINDNPNNPDHFNHVITLEGLSLEAQLGKNIYFDKISVPGSMACADCHDPKAGYTGPMSGINIHGSVYRGADAHAFGNRKPPSAAYATLSPIFHFDEDEGLFVGGNFWDGRATGLNLGNPAADQALGPFLNPKEQNVPDKLTVLQKIAKSAYIQLWEQVWGPLTFDTPEKIDENYGRVGLSIAEYEASVEVNQFSSKFDYYLLGLVGLTEEEQWGMELFNSEDKGKCSLCHISEGEKPLFTDFTFDNLGVPKNPENPVYDYDPVFVDYGLGAFLATEPAWESMADENMGKQKVPTLRNVDKRPGAGFTKAYMHNGVFKSGLTDAEEDAIVAFMKTLSDGYILK